MAFWTAWFAPKCDGCDEKMIDVEPHDVDGRKLCDSCHGKHVKAEAEKEAERVTRRAAEEEARAKLEGKVDFAKGTRNAYED